LTEPRQVSAHPRLVIGVSGGSASGKTAITQAAARTCTPLSVVVLTEDDYYTDRGSKAGFDASDFNFDHPCARDHALLARHLSTLKVGRTIESPIYDFALHSRRADTRTVEPADVIIVEGLHIFCHKAVRACLDLKIYVSAPDDIRLARRLLRDMNERGRTAHSVVHQYLRTVRPMHREWTSPGQTHADILIRNDTTVTSPAQHLPRFFDRLAEPVADAITTFMAER